MIRAESFMVALGERVRGPGRTISPEVQPQFSTVGRATTIDIDLKADPEPAGFFEALALLKDELDVNVELATPDDFIPAIPGGATAASLSPDMA